MGHAEPASGVCSVAKCLIMMERGYIPPNLHYVEPNPYIPGLVDGRLQVQHCSSIALLLQLCEVNRIRLVKLIAGCDGKNAISSRYYWYKFIWFRRKQYSCYSETCNA